MRVSVAPSTDVGNVVEVVGSVAMVVVVGAVEEVGPTAVVDVLVLVGAVVVLVDVVGAGAVVLVDVVDVGVVVEVDVVVVDGAAVVDVVGADVVDVDTVVVEVVVGSGVVVDVVGSTAVVGVVEEVVAPAAVVVVVPLTRLEPAMKTAESYALSLTSAIANFMWFVSLGVTVAVHSSTTVRPSNSVWIVAGPGSVRELFRNKSGFVASVPSPSGPALTVLTLTALSPAGVGTVAQFSPLTKKPKTSLNSSLTYSLYSSEPNT